MLTVKVDFGDDLPSKLDVTRQLIAAKAATLVEAQAVLREEQAKGHFPTGEDEYALYLYNRGRESRRTLATINPYYLRIPYSLRWVQLKGGTEAVKEAAIFAVETLRRRAPFYRGDYLASISIFVGNRAVSTAALRAMDLAPDVFVAVAPNVQHAAPIERGFYKGQYQTEDADRLRGGVVRPVAKLVRDRFGDAVAARFVYLALGGERTMPAVEFGIAGGFAQNDARPGSRRRRRGRR